MTHPNHQTNGASLEDCHTNFFALTDLCGIKWRKLVHGESGFNPEPLDDPVLASFARCLAADILCVWRRVATTGTSQGDTTGNHFDAIGLAPAAAPIKHPPLSLHAAKELWIFWYGEEPDLSGLVSPELLAGEGEQGSWEGGLTYECRSLLFKALHNLIERCLLSRDCVRLGKFFVQPHDGHDKVHGKNTYLSFSFAFFLHGESTVCASVDVREHPPVYTLTRQHLQTAGNTPSGYPVILAPNGLAGQLTGVAFKPTDATTARFLEEWRQFYPIAARTQQLSGNSAIAEDLPPVVEVLVGGVKMKYPTCYVLATDLDEPGCGLLPAASGGTNGKIKGAATVVSPPHSPCAKKRKTVSGPVAVQTGNTIAVTTGSGGGNAVAAAAVAVVAQGQLVPSSGITTGHHVNSMHRVTPRASVLLPEWTWQECVTECTKRVTTTTDPETQQPLLGSWNFSDPTRRTNCSCCKRRKLAGGGGDEKAPRRVPFHRRRDPPLRRAPRKRSSQPQSTPTPATQPGYPRSQSMTPNPPTVPHLSGELPIPSVSSPPSAAPSPLPNPHSQPASIPPADPTMPTLSPHPPATQPATPVKAPATPAAAPATPSAGSATVLTNATQQPKSVTSHQVFSPFGETKGGKGGGEEEGGLRRPILAVSECEMGVGDEEMRPSEFLYDYSALEAWLNHPVRKFKPDPYHRNSLLNNDNRRRFGADLYTTAHHPSSQTAAPPASPASACHTPALTAVATATDNSCSAVFPADSGSVAMLVEGADNRVQPPQQPLTATRSSGGDPYEFDEDPTAAHEEDRNSNSNSGKCNALQTVAGNLFTSEGLTASYSDLDQIFDNSDDTSSDEPAVAAVPTPPNSNKPEEALGIAMSATTSSMVSGATQQALLVKPPRGSGGTPTPTTTPTHSSSCTTSCSSSSAPHMGILRPEELCKMFPTPPSMEHNPIASPGGHLSDGQLSEVANDGGTVAGATMIGRSFKQEIVACLGSPKEEAIEDWSYVFRPPTMCKIVGSSKYAPLTNLPSQNLPPVTLPTNCIYKPSWLQPAPTPSDNKAPITSNTGSQSNPPRRNAAAAAPNSPQSPLFRNTPNPCNPLQNLDLLPSPATSTSSSYLNRNVTSVEPGGGTPMAIRAPEANAIVVNVLLADTVMNLFRDHNFDSCTLCVCNAGVKCVGNIRGADAGYYFGCGGLDSVHAHHDDDGIRCNCGFSAVINRRLSHRAGLFYEDELEITGRMSAPPSAPSSPSNAAGTTTNTNSSSSGDTILPAIVELLREQLVVVQCVTNSVHRAARPSFIQRRPVTYADCVNVLELADCCEVAAVAIEQGRLAVEGTGGGGVKGELDVVTRHKMAAVHRWPFIRAAGPACSQDIIRIMKSLQPILQEAIQKKCTTRLWEAPYTVSGPLTWRQFHRLAGRGTDDRCEPQPVPTLLVGYEKDWVSLAPYALPYWERLMLEPYSYARDVAYVVVVPDQEWVLPSVRRFFRELSSIYETCRLGRHSPITKVLRDGLLRVGKATAAKLAKEPVDEWFSALGDSPTAQLLRLYAQACRYHLAPHLSQVQLDRTLLEPETTGRQQQQQQAPSPMMMAPPISGIGVEGEKGPATPKMDQGDPENLSSSMNSSLSELSSHDDDDAEPPSLVVYLIDPFSFGQDNPELQRLACIALLKCYTTVVQAVPEQVRANMTVQVVSLESILELGKSREARRFNDHMRAMALSVFSQCRRLLQHTSNVKSLTGFGTAAATDLFLKSKDEKNRTPYRTYTPPYILAPLKKERMESPESFAKTAPQPGSVLYVSYCLSEDQRFLLTAVTDDSGSIFESTLINIEIPNRSRRKKASARRIGLQKLMDFVLGVVSQTVQPWRLVIGRIGRIGHGELKGWSWLLSRKSLLKASKHLREICQQCSILPMSDVPCILSACLVSLEPDSALRLMPDQFTPDERFSQQAVNCQLSTPQDVTCTHILVFPTSARTQSSQTAFNEQHINGPDLGDDDIFSALDADDVAEGIDGMQDEFSDIFSTWPGGPHSPAGSPTAGPRSSSGRLTPSGAGSPGQDDGMELDGLDAGVGGITGCGAGVGGAGGAGGGPGGAGCSTLPNRTGGLSSDVTTEEVGTLLQQPLALGYFVSTAPTGPMPSWFWASCPHLEHVCPVFLKHALHMHSPNVQQSSDDILQQPNNAVTQHPLDSQYTTDVLRYVLEGYNALSWLALDSNTHDRLSCLPVHIQVLMQLYHMTASLIETKNNGCGLIN